MKPRKLTLSVERAIAHLLRARAELEQAADTLAGASEAASDRLALAAEVAAAQAELAEGLAAAVGAAPEEALDVLLAALAGEGRAATRRH